jgi:tetratricopeptide (TPR) repeat protein
MKRIFILLLIFGCGSAFAQKQAKPNINKAIKSWEEGKLAEAKDMIDQATTYEKTMNDGTTWFYRGVIYSSIDTTSNEAFKSLDPNPLKVAMASFAKANELKKGGKDYYVTVGGPLNMVLSDAVMENLANFYLQQGINKFQEEQDNQGSLAALRKSQTVFEKGMTTYRNDSLAYYVMALVAQQSDSIDLSIDMANKYLAKGGTSKDAYLILYQIYSNGERQDREKALAIMRDARKKHPNVTDFARYEIGLLIDMNKIDEAKVGLQQEIEKEPGNKDLQFLLGYTYNELKDYENARKHFSEALKIDPQFFNAQYYLAVTYLLDVDKISKELSATGNTPADSKKRSALVQQRVKASEVALPYLEKAEKLKAPDKDTEIDVLQKLALMYYYIADDKNAARVDKKLKDLGVTD